MQLFILLYIHTWAKFFVTRENPEEKDHDERVSKEDKVGQPACDGRLVHKVMEREQE